MNKWVSEFKTDTSYPLWWPVVIVILPLIGLHSNSFTSSCRRMNTWSDKNTTTCSQEKMLLATLEKVHGNAHGSKNPPEMFCGLPSVFGWTCGVIKCSVARLIGWWNDVAVLHPCLRAAPSERTDERSGPQLFTLRLTVGVNYCRPSVSSHLFHSPLSHLLLISQGPFIKKRPGASKAFAGARLNLLYARLTTKRAFTALRCQYSI